jgi:flagellar biogenesis protein FliO
MISTGHEEKMLRRSGWIVIVMFLLFGQDAYCTSKNVGDFDINKVRKAVQYTDTGLGETGIPQTQRENITILILRIVLYLGVVIILIVTIAWFVRKKGLHVVRGNIGGAMDVIETLPIGQNRMIAMVRVMDEIYLISMTATDVALLDKIGGEKALEIISASKGGGTIMPFKEAFDNFMGKIRKPS